MFQKLSLSKSSSIVLATLMGFAAHAGITIPNAPLVTQKAAKPLVMLTVGKEHRMFYEAYNDASDIDGDGTIDIRFKPSIAYYGLFDPSVCYIHSGGSSATTDLFTPTASANGSNKICSGSARWSGNWLNYVTTSRIDALRKVLYGGMRDVDTTGKTVLRRAYIPQDAHVWAKQYTSIAVDGYKISDYTPYSEPTGGAKIFFGNLTANKDQNCSTLSACSDMPPLLRIRQGVGTTATPVHVSQWASKERPVLANKISTATSQSADFPTGTTAEANYTVRVEVCTANFNDGCKQYSDGTYKPVGVLHNYGESDSMLFGLLTGSYDKHMSGGRLRKVVSSFKNEVDTSSGVFTSNATIVQTLNNLRIRGFNQSTSSQEYWKSSPYTDSSKAPTEGQLVDWFNPIGEIMYESARYFAGKSAPTTVFSETTTQDTAVGLSSATWDDPYKSTSTAKAPYCARPSMLVISDIGPSFDSDQLPGSFFYSFTGDLSNLNVSNEADVISANESDVAGLHFIGRSANSYDAAPSAKNVTTLGKIRGLAPDDPAKEGSYYSASVASWAHRNSIRSDLSGTQTVDTFVVALSTPLSRIEPKLPNGKVISLVPFAKSISGSGTDSAKGKYQPTNQIVDFYVMQIANSGAADKDETVNEGRYKARFQINFEDVEQGGDHDMDAIAEYEVTANANNTVSVRVTPLYQAGGAVQVMGYVISGSKTDGVYLVARDEASTIKYYLNVPSGRTAGYCDVNTPPDDCANLPIVGTTPIPTFTFESSDTASATYLKDPLWYAAKWGGFKDKNGNNRPDLTSEWDSNKDGTPDTYFLVQNPVKLKEALQKAFDQISLANSSAANVIANSTSITTDSRVYQARFDSTYWSGDLVAYPVTANGVSANTEWEASSKLPSSANRKIFVRNTDGTTRSFDSSAFEYMPASDRSALIDSDRINYLRGDRSGEINNGGNFRNRLHALGDLVHSSPYFTKDTNSVYVGGNDGMLHAFNGTTGVEIFAFIPSNSISKLANLASTSYSHEYFVDGDISLSPQTAETGNKSMLFASLGRGGKGLFALDVTTPNTFGASNVLWEYSPSGSNTASSDANLGYMLGRPLYAKLNNGSGAVIAGNGINSTNETAVLYIFLLNTDGKITQTITLDTGASTDNGLFSATTADTDNNGTADFIYAGDLKGNVWKFDLSSGNPANWNVAYSGSATTDAVTSMNRSAKYAGKPLFVATSASGVRQPITAPLAVVVNNKSGDSNFGKRYLFFGTGSYFRSTDPADTATQSWYGVIDDGATYQTYLPSPGMTYDRDFLRARSISTATAYGGKPSRYFSSASTGDMATVKGWVIDWNVEPGERVITESVQYKLKEFALIASSLIPSATNPCVPGGSGYINAIDPWSGSRISGDSVFDVNADNSFSDDKIAGISIGSVNLGVGLPSRPTLIGSRLVVGGTDPVNRVKDTKVNLGGLPKKGRISWREIVKD